MASLIVGIGEVLWDIYPDGRKVVGGAPFNFVFHCHQLGHPAAIISRVGTDDWGRELRDAIRELGISDQFIQTDPEHPTGSVQIKLSSEDLPNYTINENAAWDWIAWNPELAHLVGEAKAICFGTLAQRAKTSGRAIRNAVQHSNGLRVFDVNFRREVDCFSLTVSLSHAHWVKLNELEQERLPQICGRSVQQLITQQLSTAGSRGAWIVTRGTHGCDITTNWEMITEPGVPAHVVDTVGAGDAFTAALLCLYLEGRPLRECARFANAYAAQVCEQHGATPWIDRRAVESRLIGWIR
jgi:fructokinase